MPLQTSHFLLGAISASAIGGTVLAASVALLLPPRMASTAPASYHSTCCMSYHPSNELMHLFCLKYLPLVFFCLRTLVDSRPDLYDRPVFALFCPSIYRESCFLNLCWVMRCPRHLGLRLRRARGAFLQSVRVFDSSSALPCDYVHHHIRIKTRRIETRQRTCFALFARCVCAAQR